MNRHLLIALLLSTGIQAQAANLCRTVLKTPPTAEQINTTFQALAEMKLELDLAKYQGKSDSVKGLQQHDFIIKMNEVQRDLGISEVQLKQELQGRIARLQKTNEAKQSQEKQLRATEIVFFPHKNWIVKKRIPLPKKIANQEIFDLELNKAVLILPDQIMFLDLRTGNKKTLFNKIDLGLIRMTHLKASGEVLFRIPSSSPEQTYEFRILNLKTGHMKPWGAKAMAKVIVDGNFLGITATRDSNTILAYNKDMFRKIDRITGDLLETGRFDDYPFYGVMLLDKDTAILNSLNGTYIYDLHTRVMTKFNDNSIVDSRFLDNGDFVYRTGQTLYRYDPKTGQTVSRRFDNNVLLLSEEGPNFWIRRWTTRSGQSQLQLVNQKNFEDVVEGPIALFPEVPFDAVSVNNDYVAIHSISNTELPSGLYWKSTLELAAPFSKMENHDLRRTDIQLFSEDLGLIQKGEDQEGNNVIEILGER